MSKSGLGYTVGKAILAASKAAKDLKGNRPKGGMGAMRPDIGKGKAKGPFSRKDDLKPQAKGPFSMSDDEWAKEKAKAGVKD